MTAHEVSGRTVLIVEPILEAALDLQDRFTTCGARVLTAYRLAKALDFVGLPFVSGVVVDRSVLAASDELQRLLKERGVPVVVFDPADRDTAADLPGADASRDPLEAVVAEMAGQLGVGAVHQVGCGPRP